MESDGVTNSKKIQKWTVFSGLVAIGLALFYFGPDPMSDEKRDGDDADREFKLDLPAAPATPPGQASSTFSPPPSQPLPGETILAGYGSKESRPQDDLNKMAHTFSNLLLLIKGDNPFRMGANEEFAAALRGKNRTQLRFLPDQHAAINDRGQLIDRWGTPLFLHTRSRDKIDIRSAGPDKQMWTPDDLHRKYNGEFLKGAALESKSLFE